MNLEHVCKEFADKLTAELSITGIEEINTVRSNVLRFVNAAFNAKISAEMPCVDYIAADCVVAEVIDIETGLSFRRELPVRYEETGNGVSLIGEDITGNPSQISFLSQAAFDKIKDLTGKGPNSPICPSHEA